MWVANTVALVAFFVTAIAGTIAFFKSEPGSQWPMQWNYKGAVNWRAPRTAALIISLLFPAFVLAIVAFASNQTREALPLVAASLILGGVNVAFYAAVLRDQRSSKPPS